jgi:hypothetical protein
LYNNRWDLCWKSQNCGRILRIMKHIITRGVWFLPFFWTPTWWASIGCGSTGDPASWVEKTRWKRFQGRDFFKDDTHISLSCLERRIGLRMNNYVSAADVCHILTYLYTYLAAIYTSSYNHHTAEEEVRDECELCCPSNNILFRRINKYILKSNNKSNHLLIL